MRVKTFMIRRSNKNKKRRKESFGGKHIKIFLRRKE